MNKYVYFTSVLLAGLLTLSCQEAKKAATVDLGSQTPVDGETAVTAVDGVPAGSPLYFQFGYSWESESAPKYTYSAACYIDPGAVSGTQKSCSVTVPEAKLFYSNVRFRAGTLNTTNCARLSFQPYFFRRSNDKIYNDWDSTSTNIDCRDGTEIAACYGGVAPTILGDSWPINKAVYFLPLVKNQKDWDVLSSNQLRVLGPDVNWMITNNLSPVGNVTTPANVDPNIAEAVGPRERIASSWVNYRISCEDIWGEEQFAIGLTISDQNTVNGGTTLDTFPDWN